MRLICVTFHLDGQPASAETLDEMARAMIAPGLEPQVRAWTDGAVGLALLDFSARSDSHALLPRGREGTVLAADVRLDATHALAQALGTLETGADDLLVAALHKWGADAPRHILGDYAFAAWNPNTRTLLCARDAFGVRPLVYIHQPAKLFAFASFPRALIQEAVHCRLPASGPVAAHLSGGLDSSAVAILAVRELRAAIRTLFAYSFLARQPEMTASDDETPFVQAVLAHEAQIEWTPIHAPPFPHFLNARMDIDRVLSIELDDSENAICRDAAAHGAQLVLSGWGGDEGASFNERGALAEAFLNVRGRYLAGEIAARKRTRGISAGQTLRGEILSYRMPERLADMERRLRKRPDLSSQFFLVLAPELRARLGAGDGDMLSMSANARQNQFRLLSNPHIAERTENWAAIGARCGMAFAFPLLDRRVVEFVLSLPSTLFMRGGYQRRVFRDAMENVLPEETRWRHIKFVPQPELAPMAAEHRDDLVRRIEQSFENRVVRELFDRDALCSALTAMPSPAALSTDSGDRTPFVIALRVLPALNYLEQHYELKNSEANRL